MSAHPPPVPPANRSTKGPGPTDDRADVQNGGDKIHGGKAPNNADEQDFPGNTKINTVKPGVVGDR